MDALVSSWRGSTNYVFALPFRSDLVVHLMIDQRADDSVECPDVAFCCVGASADVSRSHGGAALKGLRLACLASPDGDFP